MKYHSNEIAHNYSHTYILSPSLRHYQDFPNDCPMLGLNAELLAAAQ